MSKILHIITNIIINYNLNFEINYYKNCLIIIILYYSCF